MQGVEVQPGVPSWWASLGMSRSTSRGVSMGTATRECEAGIHLSPKLSQSGPERERSLGAKTLEAARLHFIK